MLSAAFMVLLFICGPTASIWLANSTSTKVENLRKAISDAGAPLYYTDYGTDSVPDNDNAFVLLSEAEPDINAYHELVRDLEVDSDSITSSIQQPAGPLPPKQQEAFFAENDELYDLIKNASQRQNFQVDIDRRDPKRSLHFQGHDFQQNIQRLLDLQRRTQFEERCGQAEIGCPIAATS